MKLHLTHACESPNRDLLDGAGGIPLETKWAIVYDQWVERTDPKNSKLGARPYNPGMPSVKGGVAYNGGAPWEDGYDEWHMMRCADDTKGRMESLRPTARFVCLDYEPKGPDGKTDLLNPASVTRDQFAQTMEMIGIAGFDAIWGFPRWEYRLSVDPGIVACIQRTELRRLVLDCYWVEGWAAPQYEQNMRRLRSNVNVLGYSTRHCIVNVRPFVEGTGSEMQPQQFDEQLDILASLGFRRGWVWHEGTHLTKPTHEHHKRVAATAERLRRDEWCKVFEKWAILPDQVRWMREGGA